MRRRPLREERLDHEILVKSLCKGLYTDNYHPLVLEIFAVASAKKCS
jgi:hypothetical protein